MGNTDSSYTLWHTEPDTAYKHDGNSETNSQVSTEPKEGNVSRSPSTEDLLNNLGKDIEGTLNVVRNVETHGKSHVEQLKEIFEIMSKAEEGVKRFNMELKNKIQAEEKSEQGIRTDSNSEKEIQNTEMTIQENIDSKIEKHSTGSSSATPKKHKKKKPSSESTCEGNVSKDFEDLRQEILKLQKENKNMNDINQTWETYATSVRKDLAECQTKNQELLRNNEELLNRLSKIAGQKLREDNPAITDLSDPNRPTKLGEVYSELYDNEWTDAFEELQSAGYSEEECITTLRQTLVNVIDFCRRKSDGLLKKTEEAVHILFEEFKQTKQMNNFGHLTMPRKQMEHFGKMIREASFEEYLGADIILQQKWKPKHWKPDGNVNQNNKVETPEAVKKQLKIFRKEVAESMVPLVQKAYMSASWSEQGCLSTLKPYILKCLFLGWMMVVQSPPLALSTWNPGDTFNKDLYKDYTKSGHTIEYVVWPALLLQENGPLIGKGVAQGGKPTVVGDDNKDKVEETHNLNNTSN